MLSKDDLLTLNILPTYTDLTLKTILEFYEQYIVPSEYYFELEDNTSMTLKFNINDFCHLIGVHHFSPNKSLNYKYKGFTGFNSIKNEEIIFSTLKANKKSFKTYKKRICYFPYVYQLLRHCLCVKFDKAKVKGNCKIQAKLLLYDEFHNVYMHLGVDAKDENNYYPKTFFIATGDDKEQYINDQKYIKITARKILNDTEVETVREVAVTEFHEESDSDK